MNTTQSPSSRAKQNLWKPLAVLMGMALTSSTSFAGLGDYIPFVPGSDKPKPTREENSYARENSGRDALSPKKFLTDEEMETSQNYIHEGLNDRTFRQSCGLDEEGTVIDKDKYAVCSGQKGKVIKFVGFGDNVVEALAKMYGLFGIMSTFTMASVGKAQAEQKQQQDYCAFGALGTEGVSMVFDMANKQMIQNAVSDPGAEQRDSLERAKRLHEGNAKASAIKLTGWSATSACYAILTSYGIYSAGFGNNKLMILKALGSFAFTAFFWQKWRINKNRARLVQEALDKLPKPGECNPITHPNCYCTQPETQNDPDHCLPQIFGKRKQDSRTVVGCINNKLKSDPSCACQNGNSCADRIIKDLAAQNINYQKLLQDQAFRRSNDIMAGKLQGADSLDNNKNRSFAALKNMGKDLLNALGVPPGELTSAQKSQRNVFRDLGIPLALAAHLAKQPNHKGYKSLVQSLKGKQNSGLRNSLYGQNRAHGRASGAGSNIHYFSDPKDRSLAQRADQASADYSKMFDKFGKRNKKKKEGGQVHTFSDLALSAARKKGQIMHQKHLSIFRRISLRYRLEYKDKFQ